MRVCSSWSLGSNQSWCFLSGLPRYVLAVLYTTCYKAAHSSSGVEFSFRFHWARALSISCPKLSLRLMVLLSVAVLSLVGLLVPCLLCFCCILKATFDLSIDPAVSSTHGSGTVDVHLITTPLDDEVDYIYASVWNEDASKWSCGHPSA